MGNPRSSFENIHNQDELLTSNFPSLEKLKIKREIGNPKFPLQTCENQLQNWKMENQRLPMHKY